MHPHHLSAFAILLAWQVAPLPHLVRDDTGRTRWAISGMAGAGQWEDATYGCNGELTSAQARRYTDAGARVDMQTRDGLRLSVAAGKARMPQQYQPGSPDLEVATYGVQAAVEGHGAGIGLGAVREPTTGGMATNVYLRLGHPNQAHAYFEANPLSETRMMAGAARMGVGFPAGSVGLVLSHYVQTSDQFAVYADLGIPVARAVDIRVAGTYGPGARVAQTGLAAGLRVRW